MANTAPFDNYLPEYEQWFIDNHFVFLSELETIRKVLPTHGIGVEIGIGSDKGSFVVIKAKKR